MNNYTLWRTMETYVDFFVLEQVNTLYIEEQKKQVNMIDFYLKKKGFSGNIWDFTISYITVLILFGLRINNKKKQD